MGCFCATPTKCTEYRNGDEGLFVCDGRCGQDNGVIWGTGPYTADSCVCRAARHAGIIPEAGGRFTVVRRPGQTAYQGSTRNGVVSASFGSYPTSFDVQP